MRSCSVVVSLPGAYTIGWGLALAPRSCYA
jgi:hypothetical protein